MHEYVAQRGRKSGVRALPAPHTLSQGPRRDLPACSAGDLRGSLWRPGGSAHSLFLSRAQCSLRGSEVKPNKAWLI